MTKQYYNTRPTRSYLPRGRETRRLLSMTCVLVLVGMMIAHTSRPETWSWLAENHANGAPKEEIPPASAAPEIPQIEEELVPNPTDQDPEEWSAVQELFRNVRDKIPMEIEEMPPYWRLFKWSRAQTMADMEARAQKAPFFTQFWERPDKSRGKLVSLRLHIRRVLSHEAPENSAGIKRVYELWGVTDESRGHPYVVITDKLPPTIPEGADVGAEVVFTGYFLKVLGYEASDNKRGAPLLIGKIRALPGAPSLLKDPKAGRQEFWQGTLTGGIVLVMLIGAGILFRPRKSATRERLEASIDEEAELWLGNAPKSELGETKSPPALPVSDSSPLAAPEQSSNAQTPGQISSSPAPSAPHDD